LAALSKQLDEAKRVALEITPEQFFGNS